MVFRNVVNQIIYLLISFIVVFFSIVAVLPNIYQEGITTLVKNTSNLLIVLLLTVACFLIINIWRHYIVKNTQNNSRDTNIELCRIICMLLIIAHHAVVHGGIINLPEMSNNKFFALFLIPGGKLAFDCFIAISCWFLVDQKFKMQRFMKVWLTVLFYSVSLTVLASLMGTSLTWRDWFSIFLPISGNSHGFAASYLAFYLLIPFLNKLTRNITKIQARILLLLIFYFEVGTQIIGYFSRYYQPIPSELLVFILIYILILNLKRWPLNITKNKTAMLIIFILVWIVLWISQYYYRINPGDKISQFIVSTMSDESSLSNIIGGTALFFFFKNCVLKKSIIINILASGTFGILLIHDHNFFRYPFWNQIVKAPQWFYHNKFIFILGAVVLWTFVIGFTIDYIRKNLIEKAFFNLNFIKNFCAKYDNYFKEDQHDFQSEEK